MTFHATMKPTKHDVVKEVAMKHATLGRWLKLVIIGMAFCGLLVYGWGLPHLGKELCGLYPQYSSPIHAWFSFLLLTVLPCYGVLFFAWKIARNVGNGTAFSYGTGKAFHGIFWMAVSDILFFLAGNILFLICGWTLPVICLISSVLLFFGIAIAVCAKALSHFANDAADLQEENNGTI